MGLKEAVTAFVQNLRNKNYALTLNGTLPIAYDSFGNNIYASDVVQQAISCIVSEMKKLEPTHVRKKTSNDIIPIDSSIQSVLKNPNELMTTTDFIEKCVWQLLLKYNCYIIPYGKKGTDESGTEHYQLRALYPVNPSEVKMCQDAVGTLFLEMTFNTNDGTKTVDIPYSDVIHLRSHFMFNDYFGGNAAGQPDNAALLKTLRINDQILQNVSVAAKSSMAVNAVIKRKTMLDGEKTEAAIRELEEHLKRSESGFLPIDLSGEYIPIKRDIKLIDPDTLKFIDEKILRHWGVSLPILTGDYTKAQYEAFYQKVIEPLVAEFSQAFTKVLFTERERSFGNVIEFYHRNLIFMTTSEINEMVHLLGDSGTLYENEKRVAFGWTPLKELEGIRMQSLNYVNVEYAKDYQLKGQTKDEDENKTDT